MRIMRCLLGLVATLHADAAVAQRADSTWVTVHGHRMYLLASGHDGPAVVLEAGTSATSRTWERLRRQLGPSIRVVAYDRAGLGRSESCPDPRDAATIARELRDALRGAGITPPYLLVGWSAGGLYMRVFAGAYPSDVAGLVLLDSPHEDFYRKAENAFPALFRRLDAADFIRARLVCWRKRRGWDATLRQARSADSGIRAPVVVLTAPRPDLEALEDLWHGEQRAWTARRSSGVFRVVARSGHAIHRDRADTVARVIRDALARLPSERRP